MCVYFSVLRLGLIFKLVMQRRSWTVDAIMVSSSWMMLFVLGFSLPKDLSVKLLKEKKNMFFYYVGRVMLHIKILPTLF